MFLLAISLCAPVLAISAESDGDRGLPPDAQIQAINEAVHALDSGEFGEALESFSALAEAGNLVIRSLAEYNIGVMYDQGLGVKQSDQDAVDWYRKAALNGDAGAQSNLGAMYTLGRGVAKDYGEALAWFQRAAFQGYAQAMHNIGHLYYHGAEGFPADLATSRWWYEMAALSGEKDSEIFLREEMGNQRWFISKATPVFQFPGVSVPPPKGKWLIAPPDPEHPGISFAKKDEKDATYACSVFPMMMPETDGFATPEEFLAFWEADSKSYYSKRFRNVSLQGSLDESRGPFCVNHRMEMDDRGKSFFSRKLRFTIIGYACLVGEAKNLMVTVGYSQKNKDGLVNEAIKAECEQLIDNVKLVPSDM